MKNRKMVVPQILEDFDVETFLKEQEQLGFVVHKGSGNEQQWKLTKKGGKKAQRYTEHTITSVEQVVFLWLGGIPFQLIEGELNSPDCHFKMPRRKK